MESSDRPDSTIVYSDGWVVPDVRGLILASPEKHSRLGQLAILNGLRAPSTEIITEPPTQPLSLRAVMDRTSSGTPTPPQGIIIRR